MEKEDPKETVQKHLGSKGAEIFEKILLQEPQKVDAIVFLQGDQLDRAPESASLFQQGFAPRILISGNNKLVGPNTRPEENDFELGLLKEYLVEHGVPEAAILIDDQSFNSLGQATNIVKIAKEKGWQTLLVVVSAYHALRSFLTLLSQAKEQAWGGKKVMHAVQFPWDTIPSGRAKSAREMLTLEMEKIKKYAKDVASIEEGLEYFKIL